MKDRDFLRERRFHHHRSLKSDPTSPAGDIKKEFDSPLDLRRVLSGKRGGSERKRLLVSTAHSSASPHFQQQSPYTAPPSLSNTSNTLGVDIAVEALRRRQQISVHQRRRSSVLRSVSSGGQPLPAAIPLSPRQRFNSSSCSIDHNALEPKRTQRALTIAMGHWDTLRAHLHSSKQSTVSNLGFGLCQQMPKGSVISTLSCPPPTGGGGSASGGVQSGQQGGNQQQQLAQQNNGGGTGQAAQQAKQQHPFPAPKSKFKMAHESFRARMLQEMQENSNEAVFMTKKRTADSKFSEFKGGDLNKYTAQSYAIRNGVEIFGANIHNEFGICGWILTILSYVLIILTLPISACMSIKVVQEYERAVIFRLGRLLPGGAKGPGIFFIVPCIDTYRKVDLRVLSFEVPPQEILSKDSVTVAVDAVVYFRISNATISVTNVEDASRSTKLLAQTTLRNILGTKTLAEMLSDREAISLQMQATLDEATEPWGVKVERVEVKDVRLPVQLQRAMAAEAEAAREARAKVIVAEGEQKASRALKEAADVIAESPQAIQLRYLQTLNSISAEKNSTIIFPFPIDLLSSLLPAQQWQRSAPAPPAPVVAHPSQQFAHSSNVSSASFFGPFANSTVVDTQMKSQKARQL
ncbi:hypothetical protein niasHT_023836 [Heterodera trifolii]|uniref:Band 7 domain-containing protein n=1 Tax=Heterodera trifolii TaxID=157864 RepID=A0ABD2JCC1_9BILA